MKTRDARELGKLLSMHAQAGQIEKAYELLAPVLAQRTPFSILGCIGEALGANDFEATTMLLQRIAAERTEGGWVIIGSALGRQLNRDPEGAFSHCRKYIIAADVWYATDILGERVPGPALVRDFELSLRLLSPWRRDENHWVRRTVGVAAHFWAKRSRGSSEHLLQAEALLTFLEPMFMEKNTDAIKGVGWGLKTLGRDYPDLVADWLAQQVSRPHRALMMRKALTYLSGEQRARVTEDMSS